MAQLDAEVGRILSREAGMITPAKIDDPMAALDLLANVLKTERILAVSTLELIEEYATAIKAAVTYTVNKSAAGNDVTKDLSAVLRWCAHLLVWTESELKAARDRTAGGVAPVVMRTSEAVGKPSALH
jgi:hypothetical protein